MQLLRLLAGLLKLEYVLGMVVMLHATHIAAAKVLLSLSFLPLCLNNFQILK